MTFQAMLEGLEYIDKLHPNKATGPDGFSLPLLKEVSRQIVFLITKPFSKSLEEGKPLSDRMLANVTQLQRMKIK